MKKAPPTESSSAGPPTGGGRPLGIRHLTVDFGAQRALDDVSMEFRRGEVHALLGPNGSGKSTLVKVLSGVVTPRPGARIAIGDAKPVGALTPERAARAGLRFVHQDLALLPEQSVLENLFLSNRYPRSIYGLRRRTAKRQAEEILARVGVRVRPKTLAGALSASERVLVATARALFAMPAGGGFVFVDEPTAALDEAEAEALLTHLRSLTEAGDVGIGLITHRLREVVTFADRATVLRDGRITLEAGPGEIDEASLLTALGGRTASSRPAAATDVGSERVPLVVLEGVSGGRLHDVDLAVAPGEIVGVTGLEGSGKDDLVGLLYGMQRIRRGRLLVDGVPVGLHHEYDALRLGFGLVPGNRVALGGIPDFTAGENLQLPRFDSFTTAGWFNARAARRDARAGMKTYGVVPPDPRRRFATLSGGNQQKVIVGRWLSFARRLLILHEPTAGVDVGARAALYDQVRAGKAAGLAVVVVSSDLVEIEELCDRAVVLVDGRVAAALAGSDLTVARLVAASFAAPVDASASGPNNGDDQEHEVMA